MIRSSPSIPIPRTVPVLPLHDKVLLPGVVTRLQISRRDSIPLFEKILRTFDSKELSKCIIGVFPVRLPPTTTLAITEKGEEPSSNNTNNTSGGKSKRSDNLHHGELIIPTPGPIYPTPSSVGDGAYGRSSSSSQGALNPAHIHSTGCAARLVRLERAVGGFTVVLEGKRVLFFFLNIHPLFSFLHFYISVLGLFFFGHWAGYLVEEKGESKSQAVSLQGKGRHIHL